MMSRPFENLTTLWQIIDWLGDRTAIPERYSIHLLSLQCGFFDHVGFTLARLIYRDPPSLFMNGVFFLQMRLPFWIGIQIRPFTERYFQCGIGWKGNGRLGIPIRFQHDESSAAGMDGPNYGQATYMNDGAK
jgi:hypothetical protein